MDSRRELSSVVAPLLKREGFRKTGLTWRLLTTETILVVNLQKSQWSDRFYLNCGVYFRELGAETSPVESRCHMRLRSEQLPGAPLELSQALSFDDYPRMPDRAERLQALLAQFAIPWLRECSTKAGASRQLETHRDTLLRTTREAAEFLRAPS